MIPISDVRLGPDVEASVLEVIRSGSLTQGRLVARLEAEFAEYCGVRNAVAVNNGTTALIAALEALGIGPGDEVVTSSFTFVATANAALEVGATVRLVDIGADDFGLAADQVAAQVTERTKAVVPVHLYGQPADLGAISAIAAEHGLAIVEDSAQAHGATFGGRRVGGFGVGCFSFYATKNLAAGEGGMVTTDDDEVADRLRVRRNQGMRERYVYEVVGNNYRMTDLAAAVVLPQLATYESQVARRAVNAARLTERLAGVPGIVLPRELPGRGHVWHQYTVRLTGDLGRDELAKGLAERGIGSGVYYPKPLQRYDCYREHPRVLAGPTPVADEVAATCLSLPVHALLGTAEIDQVGDAVAELLTGA